MSGDPPAPGPVSPDVCAASRPGRHTEAGNGHRRVSSRAGPWGGRSPRAGVGPQQTPLSGLGCLRPTRGAGGWPGCSGGVGRSGPRLAGGHVWRRRADDLITGGLCPRSARTPGSSGSSARALIAGSPSPAPSNRQPSVGKCRRAGGCTQAWEQRWGGRGARPGGSSQPKLGGPLPGRAVPAPLEGHPGRGSRPASWQRRRQGRGPGALCAAGPSLFLGPHPAILSEP